MTEPSTSQALAKAGAQPPAVITTPEEYRSYLRVQQEARYHVLSPATDFGALPEQWALIPSIVQIDPDPKAGEVYHDRLFCEGDEVAIAKPGLRKLARAAGLSWTTKRVDSGTVRFYWEVQATVTYRGLDGMVKTAEAMADYDLRDDSPRTNKMKAAAKRNNRSADAQIEGARQYGLRGCEARAINAAIREFGLRQKYTRAELAKPFVVFNLIFQPDKSNPDQMRMVTQAALTNTALLGYPSGPALPASVDHSGGKPVIDVFHAGEPEPERAAGAAQPFDDEDDGSAEDDRAYHVTGVFEQGDKLWITTQETADSPIYVADRETAKALSRAKKAGTAVAIEFEKRGGAMWVLEMTAAPEKL